VPPGGGGGTLREFQKPPTLRDGEKEGDSNGKGGAWAGVRDGDGKGGGVCSPLQGIQGRGQGSTDSGAAGTAGQLVRWSAGQLVACPISRLVRPASMSSGRLVGWTGGRVDGWSGGRRETRGRRT
jgi:hypothetical protein